jgi:hypothetical protein
MQENGKRKKNVFFSLPSFEDFVEEKTERKEMLLF